MVYFFLVVLQLPLLVCKRRKVSELEFKRRTAVVNDENGSVQVIIRIQVTLKSGGMLTFESNELSENEVVSFAKAFPVADLDDSRKETLLRAPLKIAIFA